MLYLALHLIEQLVAQAQNFEHFNDRKKRRCEVCLNRMFHEHRHRLFDRMTNKLCGISAEKSGRRNSECCCTRYGSSRVLMHYLPADYRGNLVGIWDLRMREW